MLALNMLLENKIKMSAFCRTTKTSSCLVVSTTLMTHFCGGYHVSKDGQGSWCHIIPKGQHWLSTSKSDHSSDKFTISFPYPLVFYILICASQLELWHVHAYRQQDHNLSFTWGSGDKLWLGLWNMYWCSRCCE